MTQQLTVKSNVYTFGVVLLQLITGRKTIDNTQPHGQLNHITWVISQVLILLFYAFSYRLLQSLQTESIIQIPLFCISQLELYLARVLKFYKQYLSLFLLGLFFIDEESSSELSPENDSAFYKQKGINIFKEPKPHKYIHIIMC